MIQPTPTGIRDRNGTMIHLGDRVRLGEFDGPVVQEYGAFRVDFGMGLLRYNSSLLFDESGKNLFEIIQG